MAYAEKPAEKRSDQNKGEKESGELADRFEQREQDQEQGHGVEQWSGEIVAIALDTTQSIGWAGPIAARCGSMPESAPNRTRSGSVSPAGQREYCGATRA